MTDPVPIPISLVAHTAFCARRTWLEATGEEVPSLAIESGIASHVAIDNRKDERTTQRRSVDIAHRELGIVGRCDVVQVRSGGLEVVEFKSAPIRRKPAVTHAQVIQLALQRLCLEESGATVLGQGVYFINHRKMVQVDLGEEQFGEAMRYVHQTRAIIESATAPLPLVDDPRCNRCSHYSVCLPDERVEIPRVRRVLVSDPDGEILHLASPGARASLSAGRVRVVRGEEDLGEVPLERVAGLVVHGNVDVSSALIRELMWRRISIVWCSGRGRVIGYASSVSSPNGGPRVRQHVASDHGHLGLAREMVASKITNQATLLRRTSRVDLAPTVKILRGLALVCRDSSSVNELLGLEGEAASVYFEHFHHMLAVEAGQPFLEGWTRRSGRGATDPINVSLNFVYGLLLGEMVRAVVSCGLDPHAGFVHSSSRNKPALALDIMEQFRPTVADSVVIGCINNGELRRPMFAQVLDTIRLRDTGRRVLIGAYERRVQTLFTHPVFGYRVTWRRAMEVQARMVLGVLDGTQERYVGIRTR